MYLDHTFSSDQVRSVDRFRETSPQWDRPHDEIILFDNYNISRLKTSHEEILKELAAIGAPPKYFAFEKDLIQYADEFIDAIVVAKIKKQYKSYVQRTGRYPCSLLTSIWYLLRLGHLSDSRKVIKSLENDDYQPAAKLINFLPSQFIEIEKKTKKLIEATKFPDATSKVQNIFFETEDPSSLVKRDLY